MAQDWSVDVKKFVPDADDSVIDAIVNYCGIALKSRDGQLVAFKDEKELDLVRENYLKKKLGLTASDAELDEGIAAVGETMKSNNFKNRVTVYYLLAQFFGKLDVFGGKAGTSGLGGVAAGAGAAGAAALGVASMGGGAAASTTTESTSSGSTSQASSEAAYARGSYGEDESGGGLGWLWWLLAALLLLGLIWWFFLRGGDDAQTPAEPAVSEAPAETTGEATSGEGGDTTATADASDLFAGVAAEGSAAVPDGAGATLELRDGKPVAKVYFDTGKTDVAAGFGDIAGKFKGYLDQNEGTVFGISGYNDPTGNAAANAELSKNRAQAVQAALVAAGVPEGAAELIKPEATTQGAGDDAAARRVEVYIKP